MPVKWEPVTIKGDWGTYYCDTPTAFLKQCIAQLEWFLKKNQSPNPAFTRRDLFGYRELLEARDEPTIMRFLELKGSYRDAGITPPDNLEINRALKNKKQWGPNGTTDG